MKVNYWIAFYQHDGNDNEVFVIRANGQNETQITNNSREESRASWLSDSEWVLFNSVDGMTSDLMIRRIDESDERQLTDNNLGDLAASWSPIDDWIVFEQHDGTDWEIFIMRSDGSDVTQLTDNNVDDSAPDWALPLRYGEITDTRGRTVAIIEARTVNIPNCDNPNSLGQEISLAQTVERRVLMERGWVSGVVNGDLESLELQVDGGIEVPIPKLFGATIDFGAEFGYFQGFYKELYSEVSDTYVQDISETTIRAEALYPEAAAHTDMTFEIVFEAVATVGTVEVLFENTVVEYAQFVIPNSIQGRYVSVTQNPCE